jgi:hypothetical protein
VGSSSQHTSTSTGPWAPAQPALQQTIPQIQSQYGAEKNFTPYGSYSGSSVAGFTDPQTQAMGQITGIANAGNGVTPDALGYAKDVLSGKYLNQGNPGFGLMAGRIMDTTLPQLTSQWSMAGRGSGNEEAPLAISRGVNDAVGALAYQDYNNRMGDMTQMAGMAPGLDAARYADAEKLYGVGQVQQDMSQQQLNDQIYQAQYNQQQPGAALDAQLARLRGIGSMGQEGSSTTTSTASPLQMATGLGMTGLGMYTGLTNPASMATGLGAAQGSRFRLPWMPN